MARLAFIDPTGRMAGTVHAVLGKTHEVAVSARLHAPGDADLVIVDVPRHGTMDQPALRSLRSFGPVLVLIDRRSPVPAFLGEGRSLKVLRKPFEAFELRLTVDRLLSATGDALSTPAPPLEVEEERTWLEFPFVPVPASAVLQRAARLTWPLWIFGEPGCGRRRVARAICRARRPVLDVIPLLENDPFDPVVERAGEQEQACLLVYHVEKRPLAEQEKLATILEMGPSFRLIAVSMDDPAEGVVDGRFSADLYRHLIGLAVQLSPLRERPLAIPPLVQILTRRLLRQLGSSADVSFTPEAMSCLQTYLWPGNILELEAVLLRTLVAVGEEAFVTRSVAADDILFAPEQRLTSGSPASNRSPAPIFKPVATGKPEKTTTPVRSEIPDSAAPLESLMAGLAHELRNPMAVIKTFAEQASSRSATEEETRRLAELADEACQRIEGYLGEMEVYGALEAARREPIDLARVVAEAAAEASQRHGGRIKIQGLGEARVAADPDHARFVLSNLLEAAVGEAGPTGTVVVRLEGIHVLLIEVAKPCGPITKLRRLGPRAGTIPSWRMLLARSVAARNDWEVDVEVSEDTMTIRCLLTVEEDGSRGQKTNRFDR